MADDGEPPVGKDAMLAALVRNTQTNTGAAKAAATTVSRYQVGRLLKRKSKRRLVVYHMLGTECVLKGAGAVLFRHVAQYVLGVLADYGVRNPTERFPVWKREQIFTAMSRRQQYVAVAFVADMMLNPRRSYRYTAWRDCVFYVLLLSLFNMIEDEVRWMKYPTAFAAAVQDSRMVWFPGVGVADTSAVASEKIGILFAPA